MATGLTPSEKVVADLCERSLLKLWTHPNPIGKNGKELCECLVVCDRHILIISAKQVEYQDTGDKVGWERWHRSAVKKSAKQIWGAERWLRVADRVARKDARTVELPPAGERHFHRVTVSLGGRGQVPLRWRDFGHGFVHLLDEYSLDKVLGELDAVIALTISEPVRNCLHVMSGRCLQARGWKTCWRFMYVAERRSESSPTTVGYPKW